METYKNLKKGTKVGLIITAVLTVFGLIGVLYGLFISLPYSLSSPNPYAKVHNLISTVICLAVLIYALVGYKRPYGNTLKNTIIFFGLCMMLQSVFPSPRLNEAEVIIERIASGLAVMMILYMAARLNKIEKNKKYMIMAGLLIIVSRTIVVFARSFDLVRLISNIGMIAAWAALCFAYVARYEEHKAAGLEDK